MNELKLQFAFNIAILIVIIALGVQLTRYNLKVLSEERKRRMEIRKRRNKGQI